MMPSVSVIVPAYNEASRLGRSLRTILDYLRLREDAEIIVVDDGSTDETSDVARECFDREDPYERFRVIRYEENRGKGYAVRRGLSAARAPIALFTDADLSTPITELPRLVDPIRNGECDLTLGSRALDRFLIGVHQSRMREMAGRIFNLMVRLSVRLPFWDTQCGFKAFRMSACRPLLQAARVDRFGFDVELLCLARQAGLRLREIPVRWNHCEGSKVSMLSDSLVMLQEIGRIRHQMSVRAPGADRPRGAWTEPALRSVDENRARSGQQPAMVPGKVPPAETASAILAS